MEAREALSAFFLGSEPLVLSYLHTNAATMKRNCVATVMPLISLEFGAPVPNAGG